LAFERLFIFRKGGFFEMPIDGLFALPNGGFFQMPKGGFFDANTHSGKLVTLFLEFISKTKPYEILSHVAEWPIE
jgi:hypothetical protein